MAGRRPFPETLASYAPLAELARSRSGSPRDGPSACLPSRGTRRRRPRGASRSPRDRFEHPDTRLPPDPTRPPVLVHIRSPGPVDLQRETGDRREPFAAICTSPCDTLVPAGGRYRISGYLVRSSRPFTFPVDVTEDTLDVRPASSTGFMGGILLVSLGVIAVQVGFLLLFADAFARRCALGFERPHGCVTDERRGRRSAPGTLARVRTVRGARELRGRSRRTLSCDAGIHGAPGRRDVLAGALVADELCR